MQIFAFQNTARQVAVGETDVYGSVFAVVAVVGRIAACAGVVQAVWVGAALSNRTQKENLNSTLTVFHTLAGSDERKTSLWKHWEYRQGYKIGVLTCKSIQSP